MKNVSVYPKHTRYLAFQIRQLLEHHDKKFSSKCHDRILGVTNNNKYDHEDHKDNYNDNNNINDDILAVPRHLGVVDGEPVLGRGPPT